MNIPFSPIAIKRIDADLDAAYRRCREATAAEISKRPLRTAIINALLRKTEQRRYLEIGVRNPDHNFNHIQAKTKFSVDPGLEAEVNLADYPMTSDDFFHHVKSGKIQLPCSQFDVIFIDGMHLADQVYKDIQNALTILAPLGFIVLHDCNPPTLYHAREDYYASGPAGKIWNGTSWKAFQRFRTESNKRCFVVDTDWGVGVIVNHEEHPSFRLDAGMNPFYEFNTFDRHRREILNLAPAQSIPELAGT